MDVVERAQQHQRFLAVGGLPHHLHGPVLHHRTDLLEQVAQLLPGPGFVIDDQRTRLQPAAHGPA